VDGTIITITVTITININININIDTLSYLAIAYDQCV
jgi:hypothetical protein